MSDLRVALVAEGPTDASIIEAGLKALLPRSFVLTALQPEPTRPSFGSGWGGVLRWCMEFASRGNPRLEDDPTLPGFDLFVIHLDADVAEKGYGDVSPEVALAAGTSGWPALPLAVPCPPPDAGANEMRMRLLAWAGIAAVGPQTVLCVPSKATDAWLAAAILAEGHELLVGLECNVNLEAQLKALPLAQRVKKTTREYRLRGPQVTNAWNTVRQRCSQADRFSDDLLAVPL